MKFLAILFKPSNIAAIAAVVLLISPAAQAQTAQVQADGVIACRDFQTMSVLAEEAVKPDWETQQAVRLMTALKLDSGECVHLRGGQRVMIIETGPKPLVKIKPMGGTAAYWAGTFGLFVN